MIVTTILVCQSKVTSEPMLNIQRGHGAEKGVIGAFMLEGTGLFVAL